MNGNLAEVKEMESLVDRLDTSLSHDNKDNNSVIKRYLGKGRNFLYVLMIGGLLNANTGYSQEINVIQKQKKDLVSRTIDINNKKEAKKDWLYHAMELSYVAINITDLMFSYKNRDMGGREGHSIVKLTIENKPLTYLIYGGVTIGTLYATRYIKKENKKLAYIMLGILNISHGYVVYHNIQINIQLKKRL